MIYKWNNEQEEVTSGVKTQDIFKNGFTTDVKINRTNKKYYFDITVQLKGSENLEFIPKGKTINVMMKSKWNIRVSSGNFCQLQEK